MFWCFSVPRGPAGQLGQEEVEVKVQESYFNSFPRKFLPESFPARFGAAAPAAERRRGSPELRGQGGPSNEPTAAVRPPQALLPE